MSIHMHIPGIRGDSTDLSHKAWIDVLELKFASHRRITSATSTQNDRESANAEMGALTIEKFSDSATPKLFLEACCGSGKEILIDITKTGEGKGGDTFVRYTLTSAIISGYDVEHVDLSRRKRAAQTRPLETLTISVSALEVAYTPYSQDGLPLARIVAGFDTSTNSKK